MADLRFASHFPFAQEAKTYVREQKLALDAAALADGEARIREGLSTGALKLVAADLETAQTRQITAYAASRFILAAWGNRWALRRMAVAESKRAHEYLQGAADTRAGYLLTLAKEFGMELTAAEKAAQTYALPFWQYLPNAPRDVHYKLANMPLAAGQVSVSAHQAMRLVEEAARHRLEEPTAAMSEVPDEIKPIIARLDALIPKESIAISKIEQTDFPPCIQKLLSDLSHSVNVPHLGRLALAIYLIKAGLDDEKICALFSRAPAYDADTTKYQVQYTRKKAYSMPSCTTMDSWGVCIAQCRCFNPLKFKQAVHGANARASMSQTAGEGHGVEAQKPAAIIDPNIGIKRSE
ncbi:DNA primase large subunit PriL [uncultured archaeon]|nr:DNA primase large subunit PriL [uncultured archaeon]